MNTPRLDPHTLLAQIRALGDIGAAAEGGRTRIALTDSEKAGRDRLVAWMRELDLDIRVDAIGNIFGILPGETPWQEAAPLMMGSHIDTVGNAGALDGCYGVLAALAVQRAYREAGIVPRRAIIAAAFTNEEGVRYQPDMMGSLVYAGGLDLDSALNAVGTDGSRLGDELVRIGYAGEMAPGAIVPREYLELHIEQGPVLEAENLQIGVVTGVQGISWQRLSIRGTANHAGTTPTRLRHDAGYAAAAIAAFLRDEVVAAHPDSTLATVGSLELHPNLINVIARQADMTVDMRDPDEGRLQEAEQRLQDFIAAIAEREGVEISSERLARFEPVPFDDALQDTIEATAAELGLSHRRMVSGAGHDAQMMARIAPTAMIFVPSHKGISHNPREHTDDAQLIQGAEVLLTVVGKRLAAE
ncbi:N-carbamoyl-L-amino-acid hydrolase [Neisseria sp. HSC-16F19]|nr:Zn-dependent hydrolase [Neisseria sp. HSC-16F19]MCP2041847.1 N-carbamoyl-L-amino-acid hydrolase [Neisseria sp. HSC-16F19]